MNARFTIKQMNQVFRQSPLMELNTRRNALRRILRKNPHDLDAREALQRTLQIKVVRMAAHDGVVLAFSPADERFASEIHKTLKTSGIPTWMDEFDAMDTKEWGASYDDALEYSNVLIIILSPDAFKDEAVMATYQKFWDSGKIIVPLMHKTCDAHLLDLYMEPVDFRYDTLAGFQRLFHLLRTPK